jgi:hypothetical protein
LPLGPSLFGERAESFLGGFSRGQFFAEDGSLVASSNQEGLVRVVDPGRARDRSDPKSQS